MVGEQDDGIAVSDEIVGAFCGAIELERDGLWRAGDVINRGLEELRQAQEAGKLTKKQYRKHKRKLLRACASAAHCSQSRVAQLSAVSGAFGMEQRYPDKAWIFFRGVLLAARRVQRDPRELLDEAVQQEWHLRDLAKLGQETPAMVELAERCEPCGARTRVVVEGEPAAAALGAGVRCPVCVERAFVAGQDIGEVPLLGTLG